MEWVIFLNVVMLSRLGYLTRESAAPPLTAWLICALQVLSLALFEFAWQSLVLGFVIVGMTAFHQFRARPGSQLAGSRSLRFLLLAVAGAVLLDTAQLAPWVLAVLSTIADATVWTQSLSPHHWQNLNLLLFAVLLLTNEVNLVIRHGLHTLNLEPKLEPSAHGAETDQTQYNAGRVIGILERYFVLALLVGGSDYTAIAVILAAKGFARFKQLDRREFAEYVLIGTLASTLSAVLVSMVLRQLLS